jgi:hypothetical protein
MKYNDHNAGDCSSPSHALAVTDRDILSSTASTGHSHAFPAESRREKESESGPRSLGLPPPLPPTVSSQYPYSDHQLLKNPSNAPSLTGIESQQLGSFQLNAKSLLNSIQSPSLSAWSPFNGASEDKTLPSPASHDSGVVMDATGEYLLAELSTNGAPTDDDHAQDAGSRSASPNRYTASLPLTHCYGPVPENDFEKMVPAQWWKTVFADAVYLKTDGDVVEDPAITLEEIRNLAHVSGIKSAFEKDGGKILDLCCGQGKPTLGIAVL